MIKDVLTHASLSNYAEMGLILFLVAFGVIAFITFSRNSKSLFERARQLPLDDAHRVSDMEKEDL